jgi:EpsG family
MSYTTAYYVTLAFAVAIMPLYFRPVRSQDANYLRLLSITLMIVLYVAGLLRTEGVDFEVYRENYNNPQYENIIPDLGYQALMEVFRALGLPFHFLIVFIGLVSVAALQRLARHFDIDLAMLILIWLLHLAVVRDLAQTRIGLAFSIAAFGLTATKKRNRGGLYLLAISMHLSSIVFVLAYELCRFAARRPTPRSRNLMVGVMGAVIFIAAVSLSKLAFLDERISLYLAWDATGYGAPVESYGTLFLHAFVLLVGYVCRRHWQDKPEIRAIYFMECLGVLTFVAFSDVAIFAFRLSNLLFSLYPVALLYSLSREQEQGRRASGPGFFSVLTLYASATILLVRPGSFSVLEAIKFN